MGKKYIGLRYEYLIVADFDASYFEIQSKYIKQNRYSTITNLKFLLSELCKYYSNEDEVDESTWIIKNQERLKELWQKSNEFFEDPDFIYLLEVKLDEDRSYGGWNSYISF